MIVSRAKKVLIFCSSDVTYYIYSDVGAVLRHQPIIGSVVWYDFGHRIRFELSRSVAHQSRLTKIAELLAQGEIDGCKSIVEQPGGPAQTVLAELATKHDPTTDPLQVHPLFLEKIYLIVSCLSNFRVILCYWLQNIHVERKVKLLSLSPSVPLHCC